MKRNDDTATEASETSEPAGGSGSSHKSLSAIQNPATGVSSQALVSGIDTAETVVSSDTQRTLAPDGDMNTDDNEPRVQQTIFTGFYSLHVRFNTCL